MWTAYILLVAKATQNTFKSHFHINTFVVLRAFMAGAASQAGDADSSRAPDFTSGLQGSMNAHRVAATVTVHQFFLYLTFFPFAVWSL